MGGVQDPGAGRTQRGVGSELRLSRAVAVLWVRRKGLIRNGGLFGHRRGCQIGAVLRVVGLNCKTV